MASIKRRTISEESDSPSRSRGFTSRSTRIAFTPKFVRCIVIQETATKGRQILYDNHNSSSRQPRSPSRSSQTNSRHRSSTQRSQSEDIPRSYSKSSKHSRIDNQLLEMIFGTIPVADITICSKLHHLTNRNQVLVTMLFKYSPHKATDLSDHIQDQSTDVNPSPTKRSRTISVKNSPDSASSASPGTRRRSLSVGEGLSPKTPGNPISKDPTNPNAPRNNVAKLESQSRTRKSTIAVVALISVLPQVRAVEDMVQSHFPIIIYRLRLLAQLVYDSLCKAYKQDAEFHINAVMQESNRITNRHHSLPISVSNSDSYLEAYRLQNDQVLNSAVDDFQHCICTFMNYPRLQPPCWLHIVGLPDKRQGILTNVLEELKNIYSLFDSSRGNFLASALTALLAYHHTWISSVVPARNTQLLDFIEHDNPVNKQISQLFGCITNPPRATRIIVLGDNKTLVCSLLFLLSFFMRCSSSILHSIGISSNFVECVDIDSKPVAVTVSPTGSDISQEDTRSTIWAQDNLCKQTELEMNAIKMQYSEFNDAQPSGNPYKSTGYSLFGSYCNQYTGEFVTMGLSSSTSNLKALIARDLWSQCKFWPFLRGSGYTSPSQTTSRTFELESASCIVIDVDSRTTTIYHFEPNENNDLLFSKQKASKIPHLYKRHLQSSRLISNTLKNVVQMFSSNFSMESCIIYLEDFLSQLYIKSLLVRQLVDDYNPTNRKFTCTEVCDLLRLPSRADAELLATIQALSSPSKRLSTLLDSV